jgi:hypothetical protein
VLCRGRDRVGGTLYEAKRKKDEASADAAWSDWKRIHREAATELAKSIVERLCALARAGECDIALTLFPDCAEIEAALARLTSEPENLLRSIRADKHIITNSALHTLFQKEANSFVRFVVEEMQLTLNVNRGQSSGSRAYAGIYRSTYGGPEPNIFLVTDEEAASLKWQRRGHTQVLSACAIYWRAQIDQ